MLKKVVCPHTQYARYAYPCKYMALKLKQMKLRGYSGQSHDLLQKCIRLQAALLKKSQDCSFKPTLMTILYFSRYIFIKANLTNILPLSSASMRIHPDPLGAIHKLR